MDELIRAVLTELAKGSDEDVVKDVSIVSNGVRRDATGKWFVTWRHPERYDPVFFHSPPLCTSDPPLNQRDERAGFYSETDPVAVDTVTINRARSCLIRSIDKHTTVEARPCSSLVMASRVRTIPLFPFVSVSHDPFSSDLSAAQHADVLFVKVTGIDEKDNLKRHCDKAGIPYIPFFDFHVAKTIVGQIVRGEKTKEAFLVKPVVAPN